MVAREYERRLLTVDEYEQMIAAGILHEDERIELLEGELVRMAPIGIPHAWVVTFLANWFLRRLPESMLVRVQDPIHIPLYSEPEPDLVIVPASLAIGRTGHPNPANILLLIEVADTSLRYDRDEKLPLYAEAGIVESWIFDLPGQRILVHREPKAGRYTKIEIVERGGTLSPLAFPNLVLALDDVLGPRG